MRLTHQVITHVIHSLDEIKLIENIGAHECLYNLDVGQYKRMFPQRQAAWEQVATAMGASVAACRQNWNLLRNAYTQAVVRRAKAGANAKSFNKWIYEDEMSFLLRFIKPRRTHISKHVYNQDTNHRGMELKSNKRKLREQNHIHPLKVAVGTKTKTATVCTQGTAVQEEEDEIDLLFASLAKTVKRLPKLEIIKLKWDIMKMVNEVENKCLESNIEASSTHSAQVIHLECDRKRGIPTANSRPTASMSSSSSCILSEQTDTQEPSDGEASQISQDCKSELIVDDLMIEADTFTIMGISESISNSNWPNLTPEKASHNTITATNNPDATSESQSLPCIISV